MRRGAYVFPAVASVVALTVLCAGCSSSNPDPIDPTGPVSPPPPVPTPTEDPPGPPEPAPLVVPTETGEVRGTTGAGVRSFVGIPYAAPPVDDLRWRAPEPPPPWDGVRAADRPGNPCPQTIPIVNAPTGGEDCLYLNVVTPDPLPSRPAPVMVWIHGGGFVSGEGRQFTGSTDGSVIAAKTGTIVVTLNYRLGQLGFLAHEALTSEDASRPSSGNYGLEDQIAALEWIQRNIGAFGGDPENVMIFGESAGGVSVCALLTSPLSGGLFHRAALQSAPCTRTFATLEDAERQGARFAELVGCDDAADVPACLRALPAETVKDTLPSDPSFYFSEGEFGRWRPTIDGYVLTENTGDSFASGDFHRVPMLVGSNEAEGTFFVALSLDHAGRPLERSQYRDRISELINADEAAIDAIEERYPVEGYETPSAALAAAFGDVAFSCPTIETARRAARYTPTFLYQFDYPHVSFQVPIDTDMELGAYHGAEIRFVFGAPPSPAVPFTESDEQLAAVMVGYWTRFAATGSPNDATAPPWPLLDENERHLVLGTHNAASSNARSEACRFWQDIALEEPRPAE